MRGMKLESVGSPQRGFDLEERLLEFAARIIRFSNSLPKTREANHIAGQVLRSGTAALPHHAESQDAESVRDQIHKFKLCLKELRETDRWLKLSQRASLVSSPERLEPLLQETDELIRIFKTSVRTLEAKRTR